MSDDRLVYEYRLCFYMIIRFDYRTSLLYRNELC